MGLSEMACRASILIKRVFFITMPSVKRLFASIMLLLFLLNVLGYYGVYIGLISKGADDLSSRMAERGEEPGAMVTFRIPLSVPYGVDSREFEPAKASFSYDGEVYQLVKQKLLKDTLYLVGIKNEQSSMWGKALAEYVMTFSDTPDDSSQELPAGQGFIKDFVSLSSISVSRHTVGWVAAAEPGSAVKELVATFCVSVVHPPERG
jgi:hypothetical protein